MYAHASTLNHASKAAATPARLFYASKVYVLLKVFARIAYLLAMYKNAGLPKKPTMGKLGQQLLLDSLLKPLAFWEAILNSKSTRH